MTLASYEFLDALSALTGWYVRHAVPITGLMCGGLALELLVLSRRSSEGWAG